MGLINLSRMTPILVAIVFSASTFAGTLSLKRPCSTTSCTYSFKGEITTGDVAKFEAIRESKDTSLIYLDSSGGDIGAAIKIANILDSKRVGILVPTTSICHSACVVVLAGGVIRIPHGAIGIHRMYSVDVEGSYSDKRRDFESIEQETKKIFRRAGIAENLWKDMQEIPPENLRILTDDELTKYQLSGSTPAYSDYSDGQSAKKLGISKPDFLQRRRAANNICGSTFSGGEVEEANWSACRTKIIGIPDN